MRTPATLKDSDEASRDEQIEKTSDCLESQNIQPLAPPPMPPMLNFLDSDFSLNPPSTLSDTQGECNMAADSVVFETNEKEKSLIEYSDSDDADDCPVFEYSVESMEVATESEQQKETNQVIEAVAVSNSTQVRITRGMICD